MGAGIVVLLRERRDMAWGAGCLICYGMGGYGLLWWAGPVSFVLPLIAFFLFFFSSIFLCCHFSSSKQYGVASPHKRLRVVREGEGGSVGVVRGAQRLTNAGG